MAWVPIKDALSKTKYGGMMLKTLKSDVLVETFIQYNSHFNGFVPGYFQSPRQNRKEYMDQLLETNKLDKLDTMCLELTARNLPYTLEAPYILNYLVSRLSQNHGTTTEEFLRNKLEIFQNIDFLKTLDMLTRLEDLDESYIQNTVIWEASKKYKLMIEKQVQEHLDEFTAEMRGNWMKKIGELRETIKSQAELIHNLEKTIWKRMPTKEFCRMLLVRLDKLIFPLGQIYMNCFSSRSKALKRCANITRRQLDQIRKLIELKMKNIDIKEELDAIDAKQMKKDGSFWHAYIYQLIKQNETWFKTYNKLDFRARMLVVTEIGKDAPEFYHKDDKIDYFNNKIQETYNKYIPMLETSNSSNKELEDEWEDCEDEESDQNNINLLTNSLVNRLDESDMPP